MLRKWAALSAVAFVIVSMTVSAQQNGRVFKVYDSGAWFCAEDSCYRAVRERYGYRRVSAGCTMSLGQMSHNERVWRKLDERNGEGWKERMLSELEAECGSDPCVVY
jgi:hypothetical protein